MSMTCHAMHIGMSMHGLLRHAQAIETCTGTDHQDKHIAHACVVETCTGQQDVYMHMQGLLRHAHVTKISNYTCLGHSDMQRSSRRAQLIENCTGHQDLPCWGEGTRGLMELVAAEVYRSPALLSVCDPAAAAAAAAAQQ
eukprot:scaffold848_cov21-Tisochrysis_lutea.AAC.1